MKEKTMVTFTYAIDSDWMMDIVSHGNGNMHWEAWIYRKDHGMKKFMFGCDKQKTCQDLDDFIEMAEANFFDYTESYLEEEDALESYYDLVLKWHM